MKNRFEKINLKPMLLVEQITETLTDAILEGVLKGGEQLIETELKEQFGISRTPLREAFRELEKRGLVVMIPRRGTMVKKISRKDIEENFPVRASLEGLAARDAHGRILDDDLRDMRTYFEGMKAFAAQGDTKSYREYHIKFHEIFIQACGNDFLMGLIQNLRIHAMWYRFSYKYYQEDFANSLREHQTILSLFEDRDADPSVVETTVRSHIECAVEKFIEYLEEQNLD